jgi:hypothetical protein
VSENDNVPPAQDGKGLAQQDSRSPDTDPSMRPEIFAAASGAAQKD